MNAPLRRVGVVAMILFGLLFANLNWVQAYKADEYRNSDYNGRVQVAEYERERGKIVAGGKVLAQSKATNDDLKFQRTYPFKETYAHVIGYKPVNLGDIAVENYENEFLAGTSDSLFGERFRDMWRNSKSPGGNVLLTLSPTAQETAVRELANNNVGATRGAVIALNPRSGAVLAMASMPSFDPNPLVSHSTKAAQAAYDKLLADPKKPLLNRALAETFPPGSTFKVIDSAAALEAGLTAQSELTGGSTYKPPDTSQVIGNAPGVTCPNKITLKQALTVSCNTAFTRLAVEKLGADTLKRKAQDFGFGDGDLRVGQLDDGGVRVAASQTGDIKDPDGTDDLPALAQSAIGQANVRMTPLQGALMAATVANGGSQMRPYLVQVLQGPDLTTNHYTASPRELRRPVDPQVAATLQDMMISVVENGSGRKAQIDGYTVGGKTGTAQAGEGVENHGWFIGFVKKGDEPIAAVAVLLQNAGQGGSAEAARIAGQVMKSITRDRGNG
ncbi:peptidoglycan D,D-transpeptidase FtsI family protein [Rhizomonospora bruguierae]|uniref:peptidoglycan D,D-transpeptidase FtsI family protein n=1 Tax=Rhizomonospora bruguierae TaxID=1581705 RepID=UPI001BCB6AB0|nr:penicillin-binding protein 2 [Micromonospora sp. NBRC 107566]